MLVNTTLMLVYVTKFFWWEAGYWNTMDIAHDRGLHILYSRFLWTSFFFLFVLPLCSFEVWLEKEYFGGIVTATFLKAFS